MFTLSSHSCRVRPAAPPSLAVTASLLLCCRISFSVAILHSQMPFARAVVISKSLVVGALPFCIARWCIFGLALPSTLLFCYRISFAKRFWRFLNTQGRWEALVKRAVFYSCSAHFEIETDWFWRLSKFLQSGGLVRSRPPLCRKLGPLGGNGFRILYLDFGKSFDFFHFWLSAAFALALELLSCCVSLFFGRFMLDRLADTVSFFLSCYLST